MSKRKNNQKNGVKGNRSLRITTSQKFDENECNTLNSPANSSNENENDLFDKTDKIMAKRKNHLKDFSQNRKRTKVLSDADDDVDDEMNNTFGKSTENLTSENPQNKSSNPSLTTTSTRPSNNKENATWLGLNKSVLMSKKNQSFTNKRSNELTDDNNEGDDSGDHAISSAKDVEHSKLEASQSKCTNDFSKRQRISHPNCASTITIDAPTNSCQRNSNLSHTTNNNVTVDRSLICSVDKAGEPIVNRSSINANLKLRSIDIRNTIEYRELEGKNKELEKKIDNLKDALSRERKERRKINETHMLKPRASFWNELSIFMDSHAPMYKGDNQTLDEIAPKLRLTDQAVQDVQRDAEKPDKIAMNIWRRLCPTIDDKIMVRSIKNVPVSTLENIYAFARLCRPKSSFNYKKMKDDIAANIRQGNLAYRNRQSFVMNQDLAEQTDVNNDEGEDGDNEHDSGNEGDGEDGENNTDFNVDPFLSNLREASNLFDDLDDHDDDEEE